MAGAELVKSLKAAVSIQPSAFGQSTDCGPVDHNLEMFWFSFFAMNDPDGDE